MPSLIRASVTAEAPERAAPEPGRWSEVVAALWRRPLARAALLALLCVHGLAILAPLLSNERPYLLHASEPGAYRAAHNMLPVLLEELAGTLASPDAALRAPAQVRALELRLDVLARNLPPEARAPLEDARGEAAELARAARRGELERARAAQARLDSRIRGLPPDLAPGRAALVPRRTWPLLAALTPAQVACMLLWGLAAMARLWGPAALRRGGAGVALLLLGAPLSGALAWQVLKPVQPPLFAPDIKLALSSGALAPVRVVFAPLAMGYAETHLEESFRPPTWSAAGRGEAPPGRAGPAGPSPRAAAVDVRPGEPRGDAPWRHALGTDQLGRDVLARLLWGGRVTLAVGLLAALLTTLLGTALGALAGYLGGRADFALSRLIEVLLSIPALYLILLAAAVSDPARVPPMVAIVALIALVSWTGVARLVRAEFLRLREVEYVLAARALGVGPARIVLRHMLPNALAPVLVAFTFAVAMGMLTESVVSFLGFGIRHPLPSWGALISASRSAEHWWVQVFPGLLLLLTVTCYHLLGDALRDVLDPRHPGSPP